MPFVIPSSTRGQRPQKSLCEVFITRVADLIAGNGLEKYRVELDLKQEAEEMMPSARAVLPSSSSSPSPSAAAAVDNESDTSRLVVVPGQSDEKVVVNKYGAHFVWVPTLARYIARADRKSVRGSVIAGRLCFVFQNFMLLLGLYCVFIRSVECAHVDDGRSLSAMPATSVSELHRPGWEYFKTKSILFDLFFFFLIVPGTFFQGMLLRSGDKSAGNPGFLSLDGEEVAFDMPISSSAAGGGGDSPTAARRISLPQELRRSCKTCGIPQPLRCRHCRQCGRCVPRSDHHCFFLCKCVGSFDYGGFVLVVLMMATMCTVGLDLLMGSWLDVYKTCGVPGSPKAGWFSRQFHANGFLFCMIVAGLVACSLLWVLFLSHVVFTATETTTYEFARPGKNSHMRYYSCEELHHGASNKGGAASAGGGMITSSPFSDPRIIGNFTTLWWYFGFRSIRRRFHKVLPQWFLQAGQDQEPGVGPVTVLRSGSPDGVNYFVSTTTPPSETEVV